ncbi:hypothetical protein O0I10_001138, partial [Lichtheimia ornata]
MFKPPKSKSISSQGSSLSKSDCSPQRFPPVQSLRKSGQSKGTPIGVPFNDPTSGRVIERYQEVRDYFPTNLRGVRPKRYGSHGAILESTSGSYPSSTSGSNGGRTNHSLLPHHHRQQHDNRPIKKVHQLKSKDSSLQSSRSYRDDTHRELPSASPSSSSSSRRYKKNHQQRSRPRLHNEDIILSSESDSEGSDVDLFRPQNNNNKQTSSKRPTLFPSSSTSTSRSSNKARKSTLNEKDLMVIDDDSSDHGHPVSTSSPFSLKTPPRTEQSAPSSSTHKGKQRSPSPATLFEKEATSSKPRRGHNGHGIILRDDDDDDFQAHKKQKRESRSPELFQSESSRRRSESIDRIGKAVFMSVDEEMDHLLNNGPTRDLRDSPRFSSGKFNAFKSPSSSLFSKAPPPLREHSSKVTLIDSDEEEPALRRRGISVPKLDDEDSGKEEEIHWLQEDEKKEDQEQRGSSSNNNNKQKRKSKSDDEDDGGEYSEDAKPTTVTKKKRSLSKGKPYTQSATRSSRRLAAKQEPLCISIDEDSDDQAIPVQTIYATSEEEQPMCRYPPIGSGGVILYPADYNRLEKDDFLNDTLIEFYLRWLLDQSGTRADEIYIFSSFFYERLSNSRRGDPYEDVKRWTRKVDVFSKKFLLVPVNENLHWYFMIIVNPQACTEQDSEHVTRIFILDSMGGRHMRAAKTLNAWLKCEAKHRLNLNDKDVKSARIVHAEVPRQKNAYDCGVYLLHSAEVCINNTEIFEDILLKEKPDDAVWQIDELVGQSADRRG